MNHLSDLSCTAFAEALAAKASVPGGGGASALVGALGTALCSMAGNFTIGKKKYEAYEADIQGILAECEVLRCRMLELIDADAAGFAPLSRAYAIPREDPSRDTVMAQALVTACQAPMEMVQLCGSALLLLEQMLEKGSRLLLADVGCGALLCRAAMESAALSVFVNTGSLKDRELAGQMEQQVENALEQYLPLADRIAASVTAHIRKEA